MYRDHLIVKMNHKRNPKYLSKKLKVNLKYIDKKYRFNNN